MRYSSTSVCSWRSVDQSISAETSTDNTMICSVSLRWVASRQWLTIFFSATMSIGRHRVLRPSVFCSAIRSSIRKTSFFSVVTTRVVLSTGKYDATPQQYLALSAWVIISCIYLVYCKCAISVLVFICLCVYIYRESSGQPK